MRKIFLLVLTLTLPVYNMLAQPAITFLKTSHDFGMVANLDYPPAAFEFKNTGDQPLAILMVNKAPDIKVGYEKKFIQPGETGRILVLPDLNKMGPFDEKIEVMTNAGAAMYTLTIAGEVTSIQACFPDKTDMNVRKVIVINKVTKDPVPGAAIAFTFNMSTKFAEVANRRGEVVRELKTGQYAVLVKASGYEDLSKQFYLRRSQPVLYFELNPLQVPAVTAPEITRDEPVPPSQPQPVITSTVLPEDQYAANNLVLLLDVSLSMKSDNKLEQLKASVKNLVEVLRPIDKVSLITYAGSPTILLKSVDGNEKEKMIAAIDPLQPGGVTNGVKGLESAYQLAKRKFVTSGNNQIILATDGKFTAGGLSVDDIQRLIVDNADKGITLSIVGFGLDDQALSRMKDMAAAGKGKYIHVSEGKDISNLLIDEVKENSYRGN